MKSLMKKAWNENLPLIWLGCTLVGLLAVCLLTIGKDNISGLLFADGYDMGMDHFNSIMVTANRKPYTEYQITYPPLAAMFYYFFFLLLDKGLAARVMAGEITARDLRMHSSAWMPLIMLMLICIVSTVFIVQAGMKHNNRNKAAVIFAFLFSGGFMFALDRGNNIFLVFVLLLFYDSENKVLSELAVISLALATGLKLYPIIFGVLLIKKHKIWQGFRALGYIVLLVFLPFFFFEGWDAVGAFLSRYSMVSNPVHPGALNFVSVLDGMERVFKFQLPRFISTAFTVLFILCGVVFSITAKKGYKTLLYAALAVIGFAGVSPYYTVVLTFLPLLFLFEQHEGKWDTFYIVTLLFLNIPCATPIIENIEKYGVSLVELWHGILVLVLMIAVLTDGLLDFIRYIKAGEWKYLLKTEKQMQALTGNKESSS